MTTQTYFVHRLAAFGIPIGTVSWALTWICFQVFSPRRVTLRTPICVSRHVTFVATRVTQNALLSVTIFHVFHRTFVKTFIVVQKHSEMAFQTNIKTCTSIAILAASLACSRLWVFIKSTRTRVHKACVIRIKEGPTGAWQTATDCASSTSQACTRAYGAFGTSDGIRGIMKMRFRARV